MIKLTLELQRAEMALINAFDTFFKEKYYLSSKQALFNQLLSNDDHATVDEIPMDIQSAQYYVNSVRYYHSLLLEQLKEVNDIALAAKKQGMGFELLLIEENVLQLTDKMSLLSIQVREIYREIADFNYTFDKEFIDKYNNRIKHFTKEITITSHNINNLKKSIALLEQDKNNIATANMQSIDDEKICGKITIIEQTKADAIDEHERKWNKILAIDNYSLSKLYKKNSYDQLKLAVSEIYQTCLNLYQQIKEEASNRLLTFPNGSNNNSFQQGITSVKSGIDHLELVCKKMTDDLGVGKNYLSNRNISVNNANRLFQCRPIKNCAYEQSVNGFKKTGNETKDDKFAQDKKDILHLLQRYIDARNQEWSSQFFNRVFSNTDLSIRKAEYVKGQMNHIVTAKDANVINDILNDIAQKHINLTKQYGRFGSKVIKAHWQLTKTLNEAKSILTTHNKDLIISIKNKV